MNYSDTERICSVFDSYGLLEVSSDKDADIVIFNTCSIKQKAEDRVFGFFENLRKIKKKFPNRKFGVTGCMVKQTGVRDKESPFYSKDALLRRSDILDFLFRIHDLPKLPEILGLGNLERDFFQIQQKLKNPFQAIVPIQVGCDNFCTYCIVPFTRGREFSRSIEDILREINFYTKKGAKEILLVGQNVNSYGKGTGVSKRKWDEKNSCWFEGNEKTPFTLLLEKINEIDGVKRIRFQSSNPHDMTDDILEAIKKLPKVMPSLHFALQSGNDEILKKMNRRHTYQKFKEICQKLRKGNEDFAITTDLIVGFCDETEEQFLDTLKALEELEFDMIYISQYSERKGTHASEKMKDSVPHEVKNKRWHRANEALKKSVKKRLSRRIGREVEVLIEKNLDGVVEGKTRENYICRFPGSDLKVGEIVKVKVSGISQWALEGEVF